jgi:PAT family beta-lactamase induction signal transducer AmpG
MMFLGFSAGLPYLLVFSTLTVWLTEAGVTRTTIGFFSWIGITYSIKVIWAPIVDQVKLPVLNKLLGQRRSWMFLAQIGVASGLMLMAGTDPLSNLSVLVLAGLLVAFSSATQDISIDAFRIESAVEQIQAALSAAYVFGYRLALLVAGAGALYIAQYSSWQTCYFVMAALMSVGAITVLLVREPERLRPCDDGQFEQKVEEYLASSAGLQSRISHVLSHLAKAVMGPFVDFFRRHGLYAFVILLFISVYKISDITMGVMANPFYLDIGFSKQDIADITKIFGFFMVIAGSALGGVFVARWGCGPILVLGAIMVATTNLMFAYLATLATPTLIQLAVVVSADNLISGLASVAFIAYLSGLTSSTYTATQYALFSSLMTLPGKFIGGFSGAVVDQVGYAWFFINSSLIGIPAIFLAVGLVWHDRKRLKVAGLSDSTEVGKVRITNNTDAA